MADTPLQVYRRQVAIWQSKSFEERIRIAGRMDSDAWKDALECVRRQSDDPAALFLALHGDAVDPPLRQWFADRIRQRHTTGLRA